MSRIRRGWELTKKSWGVLRANPTLLRFPLYGALSAIVLAIVLLGPAMYLIETDSTVPGYILAGIGSYVLILVALFFSVGLASAANAVFQGERASLGDGLAVARQRFPQIASWALVSFVVGLIVSAIRDRGGPLGAVLGSLASVGWALVTFLAVPVIALEGLGPFATLKRSASLFRERWGQQVTGNIAIGGLVFVLGILPAAALIAGGIGLWSTSAYLGAVLVILGALAIVLALLVSRALSGVFGVALYHYAAEGRALGGFSVAELESAVNRRGGGPAGTAPSTV